ncbi:predicted protein [Streptomyces filamentosus NRRL 15998]|uniref:Predicted protein n=1 Tax=Streptomyces filamentosus NRRL 15998 TaxID=457431 RepID=D6AJB0_STRFL|nr:predicted protein [Streptomyces filamentosus NRRL 15998]
MRDRRPPHARRPPRARRPPYARRVLLPLLAATLLLPLAACTSDGADGRGSGPGRSDDGRARTGTLRVLASSELSDMGPLLAKAREATGDHRAAHLGGHAGRRRTPDVPGKPTGAFDPGVGCRPTDLFAPPTPEAAPAGSLSETPADGPPPVAPRRAGPRRCGGSAGTPTRSAGRRSTGRSRPGT